jgi:hypothetical protein
VRENLGDFRKSIKILTFLSPLPSGLIREVTSLGRDSLVVFVTSLGRDSLVVLVTSLGRDSLVVIVTSLESSTIRAHHT